LGILNVADERRYCVPEAGSNYKHWKNARWSIIVRDRPLRAAAPNAAQGARRVKA
jgi:hypothetical protein